MIFCCLVLCSFAFTAQYNSVGFVMYRYFSKKPPPPPPTPDKRPSTNRPTPQLPFITLKRPGLGRGYHEHLSNL